MSDTRVQNHGRHPRGGIPGLLQYVDRAAPRLAELRVRASEELLEDVVVLDTFQELDAAHEELRVAEEHLNGQAEALEVALATLDAERLQLVDLFESAPEPYITTNLAGVISMANRKAMRWLGVDGASVLGKPMIVFVHADDRQHVSAFLVALATSEQSVSGGLRMGPHGHEIQVSVSACRSATCDGLSPRLCWLFPQAPI